MQIERSMFEPWPGCCVVFVGRIRCFHSASLHQGVQMGKDEFHARGNPGMN